MLFVEHPVHSLLPVLLKSFSIQSAEGCWFKNTVITTETLSSDQHLPPWSSISSPFYLSILLLSHTSSLFVVFFFTHVLLCSCLAHALLRLSGSLDRPVCAKTNKKSIDNDRWDFFRATFIWSEFGPILVEPFEALLALLLSRTLLYFLGFFSPHIILSVVLFLHSGSSPPPSCGAAGGGEMVQSGRLGTPAWTGAFGLILNPRFIALFI